MRERYYRYESDERSTRVRIPRAAAQGGSRDERTTPSGELERKDGGVSHRQSRGLVVFEINALLNVIEVRSAELQGKPDPSAVHRNLA
jgi:hypothetical protein